jgi:hypothetical protein
MQRISKHPASCRQKTELPPLDLPELRRQLVALRSRHSHKKRATTLINRLLVKIAYLHEPENKAHERRLQSLIAKTIQTVEEIDSHSS